MSKTSSSLIFFAKQQQVLFQGHLTSEWNHTFIWLNRILHVLLTLNTPDHVSLSEAEKPFLEEIGRNLLCYLFKSETYSSSSIWVSLPYPVSFTTEFNAHCKSQEPICHISGPAGLPGTKNSVFAKSTSHLLIKTKIQFCNTHVCSAFLTETQASSWAWHSVGAS